MSIEADSERSQLYRASLALNNVSVSLLERGHYAEALDCLRTAVNQMLSVVYGHDNSTSTTDSSSSSLEDDFNRNKQKIQSAYKYLATRHHTSQKDHDDNGASDVLETVFFEDTLSPFFNCERTVSSGMDIDPASHHHDENDIEDPARRSPAQHGSGNGPTARLRPTKIEPSDVNNLTEVDACLHMVLLLNNFGLSTYLLSTIKGGTSVDGKLLENAHSIFSLATTSISELIAYHQSSQIEQVRLMSIALLITGNLSEIHAHTGRITGSRAFFEFVDMHKKIREAMSQLYMTEWLSEMQPPCASPAA